MEDRYRDFPVGNEKLSTMAEIPLPSFISLCEWDGKTTIHIPSASTHSTQKQPTCSMAKENHMGMLRYRPGIGLIQNVVCGIIIYIYIYIQKRFYHPMKDEVCFCRHR